jgi:hypothetical protein
LSYGAAWGTRKYGDSSYLFSPVLAPPTIPAYAGVSPVYAWGTRAYGASARVNIPAVLAAITVPIPASTIIRHSRTPDKAIVFSLHRRHQTAFVPLTTILASTEYLIWNLGVHFFPPNPYQGFEYVLWNLGVFGKNVRNLYIPHKRWPIQRAYDTLSALQRDPEPIDSFVADLYEELGLVLSRPEYKNYIELERYSDALRQANVSSPTFGSITLSYVYDDHGLRAAAQHVVERYPDLEQAQPIADHVLSRILEDRRRKTRILLRIKHWTFNAPNRLGVIDAQPDYLAHSIDPIPFIPDDLQFTLRNIRNRQALQERTNLIKVQHWAVERFLNVPGSGLEYILWNIGSNGTFAGPGSGLLGSGVIGQSLATRVATGRAAAARRRRGRVSWP